MKLITNFLSPFRTIHHNMSVSRSRTSYTYRRISNTEDGVHECPNITGKIIRVDRRIEEDRIDSVDNNDITITILS